MKRILISIFCSAALVCGYFLFLAILYQVHQVSFETLLTLLIPLNFPYYIYQKIFGLYYGDPRIVKMLNFMAAVILYSIPLYGVLTVISKIRENGKTQVNENPPNPPFWNAGNQN